MEVTLHDIVNGLTSARVQAQIMADRYPAYQDALLRFNTEVQRVQKELILKIRAHLYSNGSDESQATLR